MKERPILFSAAMVLALLANRKTQTRRIIKPQPSEGFLARGVVSVVPQWPIQDGVRWFMADGCSELVKSPYGQPGDRLIVKEAAWMWCERRPNGKTKTGRDKWHFAPMREAQVFYCADHPTKPQLDVVSPDTGNQWGWRKKIGRFLPRWASRLTLEIIKVRVERVRDISEKDAIAEGLTPGLFGGTYRAPGFALDRDARGAYEALWIKINGQESYDRNDWVWAVDFKRIANEQK